MCFTDTTIGQLQAQDSDGPQELKFSIPTGHPTESLVKLENARGDSKGPEGRTVDIVLIKPLDRDYAVGGILDYHNLTSFLIYFYHDFNLKPDRMSYDLLEVTWGYIGTKKDLFLVTCPKKYGSVCGNFFYLIFLLFELVCQQIKYRIGRVTGNGPRYFRPKYVHRILRFILSLKLCNIIGIKKTFIQ